MYCIRLYSSTLLTGNSVYMNLWWVKKQEAALYRREKCVLLLNPRLSLTQTVHENYESAR